MKQVRELKMKAEDVDTVVMHDLQKQFMSVLMSKISEIHDDWFEVFGKNMNQSTATAGMAITTASCLVEAGSIQGQGVDELLRAGHTVHYQVLLQMRNDIDRHIERVRPLCRVADKIDHYRATNEPVHIGGTP